MADTFPIIDFSAGEISPLTRGRFDSEFYARGLETGENYMPLPFGGMTRRPGTFLCDEIFKGDIGEHLLIPWDQKYPDDPLNDWRAMIVVWETFTGADYYLKAGVITDVGNWGYGTYIDLTPLLVPSGVEYRFGEHAKYDKVDNTLFFACKGIPPFELVNDGTTTGWDFQFTSFNAVPWNEIDYFSNGDIITHGASNYIALDISKDTSISQANIDIEPGVHVDSAKYWKAYSGDIGPDFNAAVVAGDYNYCPSAVVADSGRLIYAGSPAEPLSMWGSRIRHPRAFNTGLADNAAWKHTLSSNSTDIIQWMVSTEMLIVGTTTSEFVISGGAFGITPTNIQVETKTAHGSCDVQPIQYNELVVFMQSDRRQVRGYSYQDTIGRYYAAHMNIAASHIYGTSIKQMALVRSPRPAILSTKGNGEIVRFDYDRQASLNAFFRWKTSGTDSFKAIGVLPAKDSEEDLVFVTTLRGGTTYLELFSWSDYFYNVNHPKSSVELTYGMYLDSAVEGTVLHDSEGYYVEGLTVFAGEEVSIVVDNSQHPKKTVSLAGRVEIDYEGTTAFIGYGWTSKAKSVNLGPIMKVKRINQIGVRFVDTVGAKVGTEEDKVEEVIFTEGIIYFGQPVSLFDGDKLVDNPGGFSRDAYVYIQQDSAMPQTIVAIVPWLGQWEA
jgi:hypothetical protein